MVWHGMVEVCEGVPVAVYIKFSPLHSEHTNARTCSTQGWKNCVPVFTLTRLNHPCSGLGAHADIDCFRPKLQAHWAHPLRALQMRLRLCLLRNTVEIRAVAVAVLAPAHCHAAPWPLATRQRLHSYLCWSPQKKCSSPRNAHQSGSTARRPHTTFWWAWNPGCNFLPQEQGAACLRRTRGPNTGSHQPCKPQAEVPHTSPRYLTYIKARGRRSCSAAHAIHTPYAWPAAGEVVVHASGGAAARALAYVWPGRREQAGSFTDTENASQELN